MKPVLKKLKVAVIRGGKSSEREISLESGRNVEAALSSRGHRVFGMDSLEALKFFLEDPKQVDAAFIALHGKWGEDGAIQGFLEMLEIPYTGSGVLSSALAMDKPMAKKIFQSFGIPTPRWAEVTAPLSAREKHESGAGHIARDVVKEGEFSKSLVERLGFPVVVKPARGGSTVGVRVVQELDLLESAISLASREDQRIFLEEYIPGRELTVGVLGGRDPFALPVLEILMPEESFFDYEKKYTPGRVKHLVPAPLSPSVTKKIQELALQAHQALHCKGFSRVDFRLNPKDEPYLLEVNTIPGLTRLSLLPDAARAAGISFEDLVELLLQWAFEP